MSAIYWTRRAAHLCVNCGRRKATHGVKCKRCRDAWNKYQNAEYEKQRRAGHCTDCNAPAKGARCTTCNRKRSRWPSRQAAYRNARGGREHA